MPIPRLPRRAVAAAALPAALALAASVLSACSSAGAAASNNVQVVVGYQSKTIDTVTAGTLLRSLGYFEQRLAALGRADHKHYTVSWQDYSTGAPITANMLAGKIDIGSMGDYPLLINGARSQALGGANSDEMVAVTAYNPTNALNGIIVPPQSKVSDLRQLAGKQVSTSVGSAGDGLLVQALKQAGLNAADGVSTVNQPPNVGASAMAAGSVAAMSQFTDWPGLLVYKGAAKLVYDGGQLHVPTFHGTVVRDSFAKSDPAVVRAFLAAQLQATRFLQAHPLRAAQMVASATGQPAAVVYLYNGPDGLANYNMTLKPLERAAFAHDIPFLDAMGVLPSKTLDLGSFMNDSYLRDVYGPSYTTALASAADAAAITGTDAACHLKVTDPATAGEVWVAGADVTQPAATPSCLLANIKADERAGKHVYAAYIPDAATGTRWFADKCVWLEDPSAPATSRFQPFATQAVATAYLAAHPGTHVVSYPAAVAAS